MRGWEAQIIASILAAAVLLGNSGIDRINLVYDHLEFAILVHELNTQD